MGLFSKKEKIAVEDGEASEDFYGDTVLGIAVVTNVDSTMRIVPDNQPGAGNRYMKFNVLVRLAGSEPYEAEFKQPVDPGWLTQLSHDPSKPFAVRVQKDDRNKVRIAFDVDAKNVTVSRGSAAEILATGRPARAVMVETEELSPPKQDKKGNPMSRFLLTVMPEGADPYRLNVGMGVPPAALPLLFPGSNVPVKVGDEPHEVVIDWDIALSELAAKTP